ncbi:hypothetical protein LTR49_028598 [Elasticomyces elasticus]|nr:hypothetical protein LTR49_028598 [Elasticomyces elasticus]
MNDIVPYIGGSWDTELMLQNQSPAVPLREVNSLLCLRVKAAQQKRFPLVVLRYSGPPTMSPRGTLLVLPASPFVIDKSVREGTSIAIAEVIIRASSTLYTPDMSKEYTRLVPLEMLGPYFDLLAVWQAKEWPKCTRKPRQPYRLDEKVDAFQQSLFEANWRWAHDKGNFMGYTRWGETPWHGDLLTYGLRLIDFLRPLHSIDTRYVAPTRRLEKLVCCAAWSLETVNRFTTVFDHSVVAPQPRHVPATSVCATTRLHSALIGHQQFHLLR